MPPKPSGPVSRIVRPENAGPGPSRAHWARRGRRRKPRPCRLMARWSSLSSNWPGAASTVASMASSLTFLAMRERQSRPMMRPRNRGLSAAAPTTRAEIADWRRLFDELLASVRSLPRAFDGEPVRGFVAGIDWTMPERRSSNRTASACLAHLDRAARDRRGAGRPLAALLASKPAPRFPLGPDLYRGRFRPRNSSTITAGWRCSARAAISRTTGSPAAF